MGCRIAVAPAVSRRRRGAPSGSGNAATPTAEVGQVADGDTAASGAASQEIFTIDTRPGVTERVLVTQPAQDPTADPRVTRSVWPMRNMQS